LLHRALHGLHRLEDVDYVCRLCTGGAARRRRPGRRRWPAQPPVTVDDEQDRAPGAQPASISSDSIALATVAFSALPSRSPSTLARRPLQSDQDACCCTADLQSSTLTVCEFEWAVVAIRRGRPPPRRSGPSLTAGSRAGGKLEAADDVSPISDA
jgi:hypothetical protein